MADCLSFVQARSTVTKPEGSCCSGLKTMLKANVECLCKAFKISASLGVTLNVIKAQTILSLCKVSAPSATNCAYFSLCLMGMGMEERVAQSRINGHKAECAWTVSVHTFSDITNVSPVVFLHLLKECYIHGLLAPTFCLLRSVVI